MPVHRAAADLSWSVSPTVTNLPQVEEQPAVHSKVLSALSSLRRSSLFDAMFLRVFRTLQAAGVNVLPNHFYWPVPDLRVLERQVWPVRTSSNIELNMEAQVEFATTVLPRYAEELRFPERPGKETTQYHRNNGFFEMVDADVAYCMVRERRPRRIIEVGGGSSTRVMAAAVLANENEGSPCELITVEPYPDEALRRGFEGLARLVPRRVQDAPRVLFESLDPGDFLFIDSSHVVTVGSDVVFEFFEIIPRLKPGVIVHLHDIFYPADYPRDAVLKFLWFWSEQYLLEALLMSNTGFEVLWASSAMHLLCRDLLDEVFPRWPGSYACMPAKTRQFIPTLDGKRVWPSSFWMKKCA
jgi:predicted O-methyltransferase YrrM